jgi:hypothetical protein
MHYVTHIFYRMQKNRFGVTCSGAIFMEIAQGPPEHEKKCIDISHPRCTEMHYMTHKSDRMQKHKFCIMCPTPF